MIDKAKKNLLSMGLQKKFILSISATSLILGLLASLFVYFTMADSLTHELHNTGLSITRNLAANAVDPILTQNIMRLQKLVSNIKEVESDVAYIYIINQKGKVLAHTFNTGFPIVLKKINLPIPGESYSAKLLETDEGYIRDFAVSLFRDLGVVHIGISESRIRQTITKTIWILITMSLVVMVLGTLLAIFIVKRVLGPLDLLTRGVEQITSGDLEHRITVYTKDEVGLLALAFNKMVEELQVSITKLKQEINERRNAEDVQSQLNVELSQTNHELEQLLYITSHDLRTPLVNIQGFGKELQFSVEELFALLKNIEVDLAVKENLRTIIEEDIPESIQFINASISKMYSLLTGLKKLSRSGTADLQLEVLHMNRIIEDIEHTFEFQIKEAKIEFDISELPLCIADEAQINQVFSNLIGNAIKYIDQTGSGVIRISGEKKDGHAVYCIEDNGIGIAPDQQTKMFDIFYQIDPSSSDGEGLGLSIVKKIIERHNGRLWVESEPGKGSRFYVSLPSK